MVVVIDPIVHELYLCRTMAGLTIRDVARRAGVSASMISDAEKGEHTPNITNVRKWANALDLDIQTIECASDVLQEDIDNKS